MNHTKKKKKHLNYAQYVQLYENTFFYFQNYVNYGPTSSLYGSLGPSNVSHTSSTMLIPTTNAMMCGPPRQSPDIIGISSTFSPSPMGLGTKPTLYGPHQPPVSMMGLLGGINGQSSYSCSSAMGKY